MDVNDTWSVAVQTNLQNEILHTGRHHTLEAYGKCHNTLEILYDAIKHDHVQNIIDHEGCHHKERS
jgi:hypothetical protein